MVGKHIKQIILGPQQLRFGFEENLAVRQDRILEALSVYAQTHQHVMLKEFVVAAAQICNESEADWLQGLFRLAQKLKIVFISNGNRIDPQTAKNLLVASRESPLYIEQNMPADDAVFQSARALLQKIDPAARQTVDDDLNALAFLWITRIRHWKSAFEAYLTLSRRPGFPGGREIEAGLELLRALSLKQDAFSVIHAVHVNLREIEDLADQTAKLEIFFTRHTQTWQLLVQFSDSCRENLAHWEEAEPIRAAFEQLNQILSSHEPYEQVADACRLMEIIKPHHDQMVAKRIERRRVEALAIVERLVEKIKVQLQALSAGIHLRNQALYGLRKKAHAIAKAQSIEQIEMLLHDAEEAFEDSWDTVQSAMVGWE